jgi:hypothetical protein
VVIGYILLIPSVLGMILSALTFFGVFAVSGIKTRDNSYARIASIGSAQDEFDIGFRRSCVSSAQRSYRQRTGSSAPLPVIEQVCECTLTDVKAGIQPGLASQGCLDQFVKGTLEPITPEVQTMYSDALAPRTRATSTRHQRQDTDVAKGLFRIIGGSFALFWLVAFFVSGLIGWLLVMKKRVLQCRFCGAVVNAS